MYVVELPSIPHKTYLTSLCTVTLSSGPPLEGLGARPCPPSHLRMGSHLKKKYKKYFNILILFVAPPVLKSYRWFCAALISFRHVSISQLRILFSSFHSLSLWIKEDLGKLICFYLTNSRGVKDLILTSSKSRWVYPKYLNIQIMYRMHNLTEFNLL